MRTIFGREPAAVVEMAVAIALGVVVILHPSEPVTAAANAAVVAIGGFVTAALVKSDGALAALIGAIKAVFALVVVLGMSLDPTLETGIVMIVSAVGAAFVRQNVVAPVPQHAS
jgi:hypothetical protein